ncbi:MAG: O-antigen ligase family protein, partial [Chloroflexota bacterium]|nr:O-antigen ligase family protein [Chloroflexota bacterium]
IRDMRTQTRGATYESGLTGRATVFGVNVSLEQYSDDQLAAALALIRNAHFTRIRQHFYWNAIEPRKGDFAWDTWDRLVARAGENDLQIVAVLDTTPVWARDPGEADLVNASPRDVNDYARFVAAFAAHYRAQIRYIEIWDDPNIHPFWGRRNADPIEYTALLKAAAIAARAANPDAQIVTAGLAPNGELIREHPDYSDILFLRGMYEAGARDYFDIAAAKPYGMWSGPDDRRVAPEVFNFSRAILLRDEMIAHGDASKPLWAVEFGWNALPTPLLLPPSTGGVPRGALSPWGTDTEAVQSARLAGAIQRARSEWGWMGALFVQTFQPNAPSSDPVWGFALVDQNLQPRALYAAASNSIVANVTPASFDFTRFYLALIALGVVALFAAWRGAVTALAWLPAIRSGWGAIETRFAARPELVQFALLALGAAAFYYSPNVVLNFALLALLVFLFALRLDIGLAITVFAIPFYLLPKNLIGGAQFSMVEVLTLVAIAAWGVRQVTSGKAKGKSDSVIASEAKQSPIQSKEIASSQKPLLAMTIGTFRFSLSTFDFAVLFFVLLGLVSVKTASNFGVAMREFRVIVIEPALLYGLVRASGLTRRNLRRLVHAFVLSGVAVSLIGLYQYFFTNWVIVGEGVRRVLAVYGSPNNLALYLDRALPLVIALFVVRDSSRPERAQARTTNDMPRLVYALAAIPIALAWYLTYSRGAWLGVAAGLLLIGLMSGRRVRLTIAALVVVGVIALIPFSQTERFKSLFQEGTGTGFFRISVWQSGIAMIRDHPLFGVGLDNFLYEYPKYIQPDAWREPNLAHPHNIVLDFWVRMGVLGVVALVWFLYEFYRAGFHELAGTNRALVLGLMASMTAALAHGMIDAAYFYVDLAFVWMLMFGVMKQMGE